MDASQLLNRPAEVTRSTVQKAVVVIADSPQHFGMLRERLSVVTKAWFVQREFTDVEILRRFQESLADEKARGLLHEDEDRDQYLGLSLRELVREFRWQTLVLLKCCLLQPKMLFFGTRCERLCLTQFSLISLIPRLLHNLQDSAGPELDNYEKSLSTPTSLRTSDRNSLLSYMGLPLQIFGKVCGIASNKLSWYLDGARLGCLLTRASGKSVRSLHPPSAARHPRRFWYQVLHRRQHQLAPPTAKGPLQRHPDQPGRGHNQRHIALPKSRPTALDPRPPLDRLHHPKRQRHVGRRQPVPPQDHGLRRQRGVHPRAV
jgi:hypothetical protein